MRRFVRWGLLWLTGIITAAIVVPLVSKAFERFAKWAELYEEPWELLDSTTNLIWAFVSQTWFLMLYSFIVGLTIGLWIDRFQLRKHARTAALRALADLFATGTANRNALLGRRAEFDNQREREALRAWTEEVLAKLEDAGVGIADQSRFRTLGTFNPSPIGVQGRNQQQVLLEAIWNEKLNQLRDHIDELGA